MWFVARNLCSFRCVAAAAAAPLGKWGCLACGAHGMWAGAVTPGASSLVKPIGTAGGLPQAPPWAHPQASSDGAPGMLRAARAPREGAKALLAAVLGPDGLLELRCTAVWEMQQAAAGTLGTPGYEWHIAPSPLPRAWLHTVRGRHPPVWPAHLRPCSPGRPTTLRPPPRAPPALPHPSCAPPLQPWPTSTRGQS